jgi:hypothetical protein
MGPLSQEENKLFEAKLKANPHLNNLHGRKFFVCDGNHKFKAWTRCIAKLQKDT